jgi:hypothetical protein
VTGCRLADDAEELVMIAPAPQTSRRDAVLFAWYVPEQSPQLGAYYLEQLEQHFADCHIFLGANLRSDPSWEDRLLGTGLDIEFCRPQPGTGDYWDASGFLAALHAFARGQEEFRLIWIAHTKGGSQDTIASYRDVLYFLDRRFWQRRAALTAAFDDERVGIAAARFSPWSIGISELEIAALQRVYRAGYAPLGLHAKETFYVMRGEIVRRFCNDVLPEFFSIDLGLLGASRYFFEVAFPNIASMQGYEPFIDLDIIGEGNPRNDVWLWHDPRQNHRIAAQELERWRRNPYNFSPLPLRVAFS